MCEPMTIAATTMAVASSVTQYQTASAKADAQTDMYEQNRENANQALARQYGDISERQSQEAQAAGEAKGRETREARSQMARARVASGESGVTGNSVRLGLRDIGGAAARDRSTIDRNLSWTLSGLQQDKRSARTSTVNKINSVSPGQQPSQAALALNVGSQVAGGYMKAQNIKPKTSSTSPKPQSYGGSTWSSSVDTR